ncbi:MAG: pyridoxal-dependent decarboxylase [Saprospiraceae bacterium]|nr:aminotransferase class V-fold PLP-dependent enzyme [Lewinella sp.]
MTNMLQAAYSSDNFREQGHLLIDQLADYLEAVRQADTSLNAINYSDPEKAMQYWKNDLTGAEPGEMQSMFAKALDHSVKLMHSKYMGHQISPPVPVATLAGLLGDFLNNGMGVYEMGVSGTTTEQIVVEAVARQLGFSEEAGGFITSGGTLANLTALLAARKLKAKDNIWQEGYRGQLALMVSEEAHYCVDRAARIMGWGDAGIIKVPVDAQFRMRTDQLDQCYQKALEEGKEVIAVVGSACTTATGSFDDLGAIADFCRRHNLWFHVDGAHGAALAFSHKYAATVRGLEKADSVAMDFHKMLLTPSVTTALIFRRGGDSYQTFSQQAEYLFNRKEPEWYNLAKRTFECTKLMIGFKAYSIIRTYGLSLFDEYVTHVCDLGQKLAQLVNDTEHMELPVIPACNIVCFRYEPPGLDDDRLSNLNERIRQTLLEDGEYYIVQTRLKGKLYLRCTLTNPFTTELELSGLLEKVKQMGDLELERAGSIFK